MRANLRDVALGAENPGADGRLIRSADGAGSRLRARASASGPEIAARRTRASSSRRVRRDRRGRARTVRSCGAALGAIDLDAHDARNERDRHRCCAPAASARCCADPPDDRERAANPWPCAPTASRSWVRGTTSSTSPHSTARLPRTPSAVVQNTSARSRRTLRLSTSRVSPPVPGSTARSGSSGSATLDEPSSASMI